MSLGEAWERNAADWIAWARGYRFDSYVSFHRDAFLELLPPPGRLTVDIGCGEGRLARDLTALGHRVVAIDASPTMVAAAAEADPGGDYRVADAAALPLEDGAVDLAVAFMSLQDVDDMPGAVAEAARVLSPGGRLCLAIVHPINSAGSFQTDADDSPFVIAGTYLEPFEYADTIEHEGFRMTFASSHRSLELYSRALEAAGLLVEAMREPPAARMRTRRWARLPLFLHLRAVKP